jgi:hypothetical protein
MVTADRVVSRVVTSHQIGDDPTEYSIDISGSHFENLRIAGHKIDLNLVTARVHEVDTYGKFMQAYRDGAARDLLTFNQLLEVSPAELSKLEEEYPGLREICQKARKWAVHGNEAAEGTAFLCSAADWRDLREQIKGTELRCIGGIVLIPKFGVVSLGELLIEEWTRDLTMLRLQLGSPVEGSFTAGNAVGGGSGPLARRRAVEPMAKGEEPEPSAQYVNFDFQDPLPRGKNKERFLSLGTNEGLHPNLEYKVVVSLGLGPDMRFEGRKQEKLKRPSAPEIMLDVVMALPDNVEIVRQAWATLEWPAHGPSTRNAEFRIRTKQAGTAQIKVLIYHEHDLLFCADIVAEVRPEGSNWSRGVPPIRWKNLGESDIAGLSLMRKLDALDPDGRRSLNISVHTQSPGTYDLFFYFRSKRGKAAVYPLSVQLSGKEITDALTRVRSALRVLVEGPMARRAASLPDYSGYLREPATGVPVEEAWAYSQGQQLLKQMSLVGRNLSSRLFDSDAGERLKAKLDRELSDGSCIQIWLDEQANDFMLPWAWLHHPLREVVSDADVRCADFWGYRYVIEQIRSHPAWERCNSTLTTRPVRVAGALHNFVTKEKHKEFLDKCAEKYPELIFREVPHTDFETFLAKCDSNILYFYCHGHISEPLDPNYASLVRGTPPSDEPESEKQYQERVRPLREQIQDYSHIAINSTKLKVDSLRKFKPVVPSMAPLIILNLCESAEFYPGISDNFIDIFLERRVSSVIGTDMPMLTAFGDVWARRLFERYFGPCESGLVERRGEGPTIGEVLLHLRREFADRGNPLAFAYIHYGDAGLRLKPLLTAGDAGATNA